MQLSINFCHSNRLPPTQAKKYNWGPKKVKVVGKYYWCKKIAYQLWLKNGSLVLYELGVLNKRLFNSRVTLGCAINKKEIIVFSISNYVHVLKVFLCR